LAWVGRAVGNPSRQPRSFRIPFQSTRYLIPPFPKPVSILPTASRFGRAVLPLHQTPVLDANHRRRFRVFDLDLIPAGSRLVAALAMLRNDALQAHFASVLDSRGPIASASCSLYRMPSPERFSSLPSHSFRIRSVSSRTSMPWSARRSNADASAAEPTIT
jgi:hypothetical protein